ncbi:hypothetical protein [uncultured Gammaproteobacteria bacterium]|jgi:hypothetical protein|nr:hypothetical protein BROOK1789C_1945 [Bathymodiolus brooksi thiotrophic gill symbiont]CAC9573918.1 hypothetical protein [uncultured Gammaproteobacteria bacterium]CAC9602280.1 hypothetical protein [uncultured Gammaproteobacteria bacterium]CAC9606988.1 hypothetical protein [uncultured Gammaproteobacteria bacterium]CAC9612491.1 hypothetical protein [uncultured Gammaproteobacteria bacterium]
MNNHQKSTFYQLGNFFKPSLSLARTEFKKIPSSQKLNSVNHSYLCKGLYLIKMTISSLKNLGKTLMYYQWVKLTNCMRMMSFIFKELT